MIKCRHKGLFLTAAAALAAFTISGCGGGGGVGFGDGQNPDPVIVDFPIAYIKRPLAVDDQGNPAPADIRNLIRFDIGAELFFRDRASPSSEAINITADITQGLGDIRDVDISFDGSKVLFAMRAQFIEGAAEEDQPSWNIWEYDVELATTRRLISSDITAEAGHDIAPHYLPDGRVVFSSSRQRRSSAILLDEGKPQFSALDEDDNEPAFVLHVMDADGSNIEQISFNQSHDFDPTVAANGQIVFSRWDHAPGNDEVNLYRVNPDGSALEMLYGSESHVTGSDTIEVQFMSPRLLPEGGIMALIQPYTGSGNGGDIVTIDTVNYVNNTQPTSDNAGVLNGPAQQPATVNEVLTSGAEPSPGGRYSSVYPLNDGTERLLVSWSQCRLTDGTLIVACTVDNLNDPALVEAAPLYGIWIYDRIEDTQLPIVVPEEGVEFTEIVAGEDRVNPPVILDGSEDFSLASGLQAEGSGVVHIRSVYDVDGVDASVLGIDTLADPSQTTAAQRPARFLRIVKPVSMPDDDVLDFDGSAFGVTSAFGMREIIGYAKIEPDGSAMFKVPANVALAISVLDAEGKRISPLHNNWLQVVPGQLLECGGCHDPDAGTSHGRRAAYDAVNDGASADGAPFPNTNPQLTAAFGETMAAARMRESCTNDGCAALEPSVDVVFADVWTDPAQRDPDPAHEYRYQDLVTPPPVATGCLSDWTPLCRTVVNYEEHVHPLWSVTRATIEAEGLLDASGAPIATCTACHSDRDAAGAQQVPAAQLDLSDGLSDQVMDRFKAYQELLAPDDEQELAGGVLQDRQLQNGIDPVTGEAIFVTVAVQSPMRAGSAADSAAFYAPFGPGASHEDYLSPAELRLLTEWVDIGAQYYNNPFDAPLN